MPVLPQDGEIVFDFKNNILYYNDEIVELKKYTENGDGPVIPLQFISGVILN